MGRLRLRPDILNTVLNSGSGVPVFNDYLFRDILTTPVSAPISIPLSCEPGPGQWTAMTDTGNRLSKGSGKLQIGGGTAAFALTGTAQTRAAGLAMAFKATRPSAAGGSLRVGFGSDSRNGHVINGSRYSDGVYLAAAANGIISNIHDFADIERYVTVLRSTGVFVVVQMGGHSYLLMVDNRLTGATPAPRIENDNTTNYTATIDDVEIVQLEGDWATANGPVEAVNATPATGNTLEALSSSVLIEFTWTVGAGETVELSWRYTDDNNRYYVSCSQAANTMRLYKVEGGVSTEIRPSKAIAWTVGSKHRIIIIHDNGFLRTVQHYPAAVGNYVLGHGWTDGSKSNTFNMAERTVKVTGFAAGENLIIRPTRVTLPDPWNTTNQVEWMSYGDSKTSNGVWQELLTAALNAADTHVWTESQRNGLSGRSVASNAGQATAAAETIDAELAGYIVHPTKILMNLGVNDSISLPLEATFKTNYTYILDALHAKFPLAQVFCSKVWRAASAANCVTINTWITAVVATRSSFAQMADDETAWLEGGDNGATNSSDGTHYSNPAGMTAKAAAAKTALGF